MDARLTLTLYALWPWLLLDDPAMEAVLELLCVYTANCQPGGNEMLCVYCVSECLCRLCVCPIASLCDQQSHWVIRTLHLESHCLLQWPQFVSLYRSNEWLLAINNGYRVRIDQATCLSHCGFRPVGHDVESERTSLSCLRCLFSFLSTSWFTKKNTAV